MRHLLLILVLALTLGALANAQVAIIVQTPGSAGASTTITWKAKTIVTSVTCPKPLLESGDTETCTATLNQASPSAKTATVTSADTTKIMVPATITIPAGATSVTFVATAQ